MKPTGLSDTGLLRTNNEDSFYVDKSLLIVADGMGGAVAGEVASSLAVKIISEKLKDISYTKDTEIVKSMNKAILDADAAIKKQTIQDPTLMGMGTTVVSALHVDDRLLLGNIGDSRAYIISESPIGSDSPSSVESSGTSSTAQTMILEPVRMGDKKKTGNILRITEDHSVVMDLVRSGVISEDEIRSHPLRNRITRCLGSLDNSEPDFLWYNINDGDVLILCSDGLWELVHEDIIYAVVCSSSDTEDICKKLITAANNAGGVDNITVITASFLKE